MAVSKKDAAVPKYEKFGECIAMDVAFLRCLHACLVVVDMATHFTMAGLCSSEAPGDTCKPTSDQAPKAFLDCCELLRVPDKCQTEQDSCFRGIC